jgi:hypothetical protein
LTADRPITDTLQVWACIGCGAMGNVRDCTGSCAFEDLDVVGAETHAAALDRLWTALDSLEALQPVVKALAAATWEEHGAEPLHHALQERARAALATLPAAAEPPASMEPSEPENISLCTTCGLVEAPQPCLGICIRQTKEVVRAADHDAVLARGDAAQRQAAGLAALVNRLAHVTPRPGQHHRTLAAFQHEARRVEGRQPLKND